MLSKKLVNGTYKYFRDETEITEQEWEEVKANIPAPVISEEQLCLQRLNVLIRSKYSVDDELGLLRQRDTKPDEFKEYNDYVEECKIKAKENK